MYMPLREKEIERDGVPISFLKEGQVKALVGPCSAIFLRSNTIPLDGRHFYCAGTIVFKNGVKLRANFQINTHTFDFLERDSVLVYLTKEEAWYFIKEDELFDKLGSTRDDMLPYKWLTDVPLDYHEKGPYSMQWP